MPTQLYIKLGIAKGNAIRIVQKDAGLKLVSLKNMTENYPIKFDLKDGTHVSVYKKTDDCFEFFLTKLNSEKHNFMLANGKVEESYETRFDALQLEAIEQFNKKIKA